MLRQECSIWNRKIASIGTWRRGIAWWARRTPSRYRILACRGRKKSIPSQTDLNRFVYDVLIYHLATTSSQEKQYTLRQKSEFFAKIFSFLQSRDFFRFSKSRILKTSNLWFKKKIFFRPKSKVWNSVNFWGCQGKVIKSHSVSDSCVSDTIWARARKLWKLKFFFSFSDLIFQCSFSLCVKKCT